jgi:transposase-like protein
LLVDLHTIDFSNETDCHKNLMRLLHPGGLACPKCGAREGLRKHRRHREPLVDLQCSECGRVFNAWTATTLEKCHLRPSQVLQLLRGIVDRRPSASLARHLGCSRSTVLRWRHRLRIAVAPQLPALRSTCPADQAG